MSSVFEGGLSKGERQARPGVCMTTTTAAATPFVSILVLVYYWILPPLFTLTTRRDTSRMLLAAIVLATMQQCTQCIMGITGNCFISLPSSPPDGPDQPQRQALRGHRGRQLPDNWAEASGQLWEEVWVQHILMRGSKKEAVKPWRCLVSRIKPDCLYCAALMCMNHLFMLHSFWHQCVTSYSSRLMDVIYVWITLFPK